MRQTTFRVVHLINPRKDATGITDQSQNHLGRLNSSCLSGRPLLRASYQASKHGTFTQCWAHVGPASQTLDRREPSIGRNLNVFAGMPANIVELRQTIPLAYRQIRDVEPLFVSCWASVADGGLTVSQHCVNTGRYGG